MKNRVGEKHTTNEGCEIEIIEHISATNITIRFKSGIILNNRTYQNIKKGQIKNPYHKSVHSTGFIGVGNYGSKTHLHIYETWNSMLGRCYNKNHQKKRPTYKYVEVCEGWCNFQNFAKWYEDNYKEGFELDKDILIKGNKIYSPETCCFVPSEINTLFIKCDSVRGKYPIGVSKAGNKFQTQITTSISNKWLGYYNTLEEAFQVYKIAKEVYIKKIADKWKDQITERVYQAMYNYQVEITD